MTIEDRLDALLAPWDQGNAPGVVVGIAQHGVPLYRRAVGLASIESGAALTPASRMRIGSVTKQFTGLLALLLAERGDLDLDVPVRTYLPELTGPAGDPSIRLYLEHRGGQRCYLDLAYLAHGRTVAPPGYPMALIARQRAGNFAPGTAFLYNNSGYHLVSRALERVGGADLASLFAQHLTEPLGLADTFLAPSDTVLTPGLVGLHAKVDERRWRRGGLPTEKNLGEGGLVSSVDDLLAWAAQLRRQDPLGTPEIWRTLATPRDWVDGSPSHYALGLMRQRYRGAQTLGHAGGLLGASAELLTFPDHGLDIVVLANRTPEPNPVRLAEAIADLMLEEVLGPAETPITAEQVKHLAGDWWSDETHMLYSLHAEGSALALSICGSPQHFLLYSDGQGTAVTRPYSVGTISLDLAGAERTSLAIAFGGRFARYRRLDPDAAASPCAGAAGRYQCADAGCITEIGQGPLGWTLRSHDAVGGVTMALEWLTPTLARTRPFVSDDPHYHVLAFADSRTTGAGRDAALRAGFVLNGVRNRNLLFTPL